MHSCKIKKLEQEPLKRSLQMIEDVMQHRALLYDKGGDQHYETISALHKALRGSDPDASLLSPWHILKAERKSPARGRFSER